MHLRIMDEFEVFEFSNKFALRWCFYCYRDTPPNTPTTKVARSLRLRCSFGSNRPLLTQTLQLTHFPSPKTEGTRINAGCLSTTVAVKVMLVTAFHRINASKHHQMFHIYCGLNVWFLTTRGRCNYTAWSAQYKFVIHSLNHTLHNICINVY